MTEELKPCPFCGNVPNWFVDVEAQEDEYGQASPNCCEQYSFKTYLGDRKSTRLNSSHLVISYAVFCLKKKKIKK